MDIRLDPEANELRRKSTIAGLLKALMSKELPDGKDG